ncbi:MAG TPA: hypothetical protein VGR61_11480 [Candidatus Dormibacteraeota bacterium]|nr:hypothetical protein [Candidatus Dormibacteraeota bacterium]
MDEPRRLTGDAIPWREWFWAAAWTFLLCAVVGLSAAFVADRPEFFWYSVGLAVILEVAAGIAMALDWMGMPGGLIVGTVLFFPWSLGALLLFRKEIPWDRWREKRSGTQP